MLIEDIPKQKCSTHRIERLKPEIAHQIAAGEVIERPASVLKELLENSLDAQASEVDVTIEQGGIKLIRVQDNGLGIHKDDLTLALEQHATSKIKAIHELESLSSFGFRGEALASISSVAKLRLSSCPFDQEMGYTIEKEGRSQTYSIKPSPKILGTMIEVRDLFYNTPARRQFLRSEKTESTYLEQMFKRLVLSKFDVSFSLKLSERNQKHYKLCRNFEAYCRRVRDICGSNFLEHSHYIESESNGLTLKGWLSGSQQLRLDPDLQYFYVNGRIIRDKLINHAIRQSFQEQCLLGRYPSYILFLEIDPASVDVNVHPTKHEVRFREARTIYSFITYTLQQSLNQTQIQMPMETEVSLRAPASERILQPQITTRSSERILETSLKPQGESLVVSEDLALELELFFGKFLTMVGGKFLLAERQENLIVIEMAGVYRYLLELELNKIVMNIAGKEQVEIMLESNLLGNKCSKPLMIPLPIKLFDTEALSRVEPFLFALGFQWTEISEQEILLRAIPSVLDKIPAALDVLFEKFQKIDKVSKVQGIQINDLITCLAEHVSVNEHYHFEYAIKILEKLQKNNQMAEIKLKPKLCRQIKIQDLHKILF